MLKKKNIRKNNSIISTKYQSEYNSKMSNSEELLHGAPEGPNAEREAAPLTGQGLWLVDVKRGWLGHLGST